MNWGKMVTGMVINDNGNGDSLNDNWNWGYMITGNGDNSTRAIL